jgi:hypothetical protein
VYFRDYQVFQNGKEACKAVSDMRKAVKQHNKKLVKKRGLPASRSAQCC